MAIGTNCKEIDMSDKPVFEEAEPYPDGPADSQCLSCATYFVVGDTQGEISCPACGSTDIGQIDPQVMAEYAELVEVEGAKD